MPNNYKNACLTEAYNDIIIWSVWQKSSANLILVNKKSTVGDSGSIVLISSPD